MSDHPLDRLGQAAGDAVLARARDLPTPPWQATAQPRRPVIRFSQFAVATAAVAAAVALTVGVPRLSLFTSGSPMMGTPEVGIDDVEDRSADQRVWPYCEQAENAPEGYPRDITQDLCDRERERHPEGFTEEELQQLQREAVEHEARLRAEEEAREAARTAWEPRTAPPDAVHLLGTEPGEQAWYTGEGADDAESWMAYGLAAWDDRLGADADEVCAWLAIEVAAVIDDDEAIVTNDPDAPVQYAYAEAEHQAVSVVLSGILDEPVGDGLSPIVAERCDLLG
jgi:hypothetical protein